VVYLIATSLQVPTKSHSKSNHYNYRLIVRNEKPIMKSKNDSGLVQKQIKIDHYLASKYLLLLDATYA